MRATQIVFAISIVFYLERVAAREDVVIENAHENNWGEWGKWEICSKDTFASGMLLKSHKQIWSRYKDIPQSEDRTGLNAIRLFCIPLGSNAFYHAIAKHNAVTSSQGEWGSWGSYFYCDLGVITGFKVKHQVWQGEGMLNGDDSSTNNVAIHCLSTTSATFIEGDGTDAGYWSEPVFCPQGYAVCGIQTQVEPVQQGHEGDNTALNNIRMRCCPLSLGIVTSKCEPTDELQTIMVCDNTEGNSFFNCSQTNTVGSSMSQTAAYGELSEFELLIAAGASAEFAGNEVRAKFEASSTVASEWKQSSSQVWEKSTTSRVFNPIPAKIRTTQKQLVGRCGPYTVFGNRFVREDEELLPQSVRGGTREYKTIKVEEYYL